MGKPSISQRCSFGTCDGPRLQPAKGKTDATTLYRLGLKRAADLLVPGTWLLVHRRGELGVQIAGCSAALSQTLDLPGLPAAGGLILSASSVHIVQFGLKRSLSEVGL